MFCNPRAALIAFTLIVMMASLRAGETNTENSNLVIGLLVPPEEPCAASLRDGATLGVEHANESAAQRVSLVIRGRAGQWGADGVEAARMVTDDGALGLIAPPDGAASHLVLQVSGRTAVPVITLSADSSVSQTGVPWMARIVPRTVDEAKMLFGGIHAGHWIAVVPDGRAGREIGRDLKIAAAAGGRSLATVISMSASVTNISRAAAKILKNHPEAILIWLDPTTSGTLAKAFRAAGFTGTLAGPGRLRSADLLIAAGEASEGFILPAPSMDSADVAKNFAKTFSERFGHEADATAAMSYDAATLLIHILRQMDGQPAHEAFPIAFSIPGATGILAFDMQGNRQTKLGLLKIRASCFLPIEAE